MKISRALTLTRHIAALVVTPLALLCACSTISTRQTLSYELPPAKAVDVWGREPMSVDASLEKQHLADPSNDPLRVLVRYQQAKLWSPRDPAKACALWSEVLNENRFPLLAVAKLRAMEDCAVDKLAGTSIDELMTAVPEPWLKETYLRAALSRAKKSGDTSWEMKLTLQVADLEKLQSDKVELIRRSISLADVRKDAGAKLEALKKLESVAPRFIADAKPEQYLSIALDFRQMREFDQARVWFAKVLESELSNAEKLKALDGIRMSHKLQKNTDLYIAGTKTYSDFAEENFLKPGILLLKKEKSSREGISLVAKYLDTRMTLARAIWTEGAPHEAAAILAKAEKQTRRYVSVDESVFLRARIEEEAGRFHNTVRILKAINTDRTISRDFKTKVLWYRAWNQRKIGQLKEAVAALESLIPQEEATTQIARDRFWLGKTLKELGLNAEANVQFQKLTEEDSVGWYGLLAYRELGVMIPPLAKSPDPLREPAAEKISTELALMPEEKLVFEWLIAGGETDLAKKFLDFTTSDRRASFSDLQSLDLLRSYARAGQFQSLFNRLYELPPTQRKRLLEANPELLFPQPWTTLVNTASSRFDVQSELIYSIMRQESSFQPLARSPADAFGLMQLIPEMAKKATESTGIKIETHEDLYRPEINIPLGTAFVRGLQNRWQGGFIPTVASYNASEKAIAGWVKSRYRGDTLVFIEDVPYEETRNYIKLVMRNFIFYKRLNSGGAPIAFPEWCLASLQDVRS